MHLGEICPLQAADVDAEARTVVICNRKGPRNQAGNHQTAPLLAEAWSIVAPLLPGAEGGMLFYRAESLSTAFTRACIALGITDLHFHDLRHRATAQFFRMRLDIPRVAVLTGHKTWAMSRRYTNIKPADVHAAIASPPRNADQVVNPSRCRA